MPQMRSIMLVAALSAAGVAAEPAVLFFPAVGTPDVVTLSGRVLKHTPSKGRTTLDRNLRRLTSSNWVGADVEVRYAGRSAKTTSGHDGTFTVTLKGGDSLFPLGLGTAEAGVKGAVGIATVDIVSPEAPFVVVSDFDDTIAVTNVLDGSKLVTAALLQDGKSQPAVEGMADFYECLRAEKSKRPGFALVSGSPQQYVDRVREFLRVNRFPIGFGVYLRDLGPGTLKNYKQPVIRSLLKELSNPVVLIGDSGEHDPEVYAEMRAEFPGRVQAIYIHDVGHSDDPTRFKDMVLFKSPRDAALDAVSRGFASASCVADVFSEKAK